MNNRKLTTILAADVVGYSRLMASDEERTLRNLRTYRGVFEEMISKHGGRIFNTAGDAVLAEFTSAVEAVRCAISVQEDLAVRNAEQEENDQMWFRIGINVGDVMIEGEDLFGDGVNIAARLEGLADRGGICISGSTFEQVKNKLSVEFSDLGPQSVKNIPEPVSAYRIGRGQVTVKSGADRESAKARPVGNLRTFAGLAVAALLALAALWIWWPWAETASQAGGFDGRWDVSVHSRTGCRTNEDISYSVNVANGVIDEPAHRRPKRGTVDADGAFSIEVFTKEGQSLNTQSGVLSGSAGNGRFVGTKPDCTGQVELTKRVN
ncbi:adenylate/guanylate cyclase domain-containing protein [Nitratireductor sp. XY-223]|uniref:adenylate/guanylate cyclase domain-containing protein n=1 Tax=Nitratireductor sp. XY-223 TaxID=2561926 RepID=UPI0032B2A2B2